MKKILFLGSKPIGFYCLNHIVKLREEHNIEIVGILSNENQRFDSSISFRKLAQENNILFYEDLDQILDLDFDYLISVQYHLILKQKHIDMAKKVAINLHLAPLPDYRGCNQFSFALFNSEKTFGTTIHLIDTGIDSGDILFERRFEIKKDWFVKDLFDETVAQSKILFEESFLDIINGRYTPVSQKSLLETRKEHLYFRKDINDLKCISIDDDIPTMLKKVKATSMPGFEPPFIMHDNVKYKIIPELNN
jgi:methionyl-tRNA formyltransferase